MLGAVVGFDAGGVAASVIDAALLARDDPAGAATSSPGASLQAAAPVLSFGVSPHGAAFAVRF
jgi:hypothetical protein